MATINSGQDYDLINTLTFAAASGTCNIRLWRGGFSTHSGTVYYRAGTSGSWTSLSVSGTSTTFPVSNTTMQLALDWSKSGDDYTTPSFRDQTTNLTEIAISQKAVLSGIIGNSFMRDFAINCSSLTYLDTPEIVDVTGVGYYFFYLFARGCTALTALSVPNTSEVTTVSFDFLSSFASNCSSLTNLSIPDTSSLSSVGSNFMKFFAADCTSLSEIILPAAGWFATNNVDWSVPSGRLDNLVGQTSNSTDQSNWQALVTIGETLHTNFIRSTGDVTLVLPPPSYNPAFAHRRLLL